MTWRLSRTCGACPNLIGSNQRLPSENLICDKIALVWSDKETDIDLLGFTSYVNVLSEVCLHYELAPLTLGVFGSWGSGKSSLMRMLKAQIDTDSGEKVLTLWFNAWRYEGKEEAQSALIHAIVGELERSRNITDEVKDLIKSVVSGASVLKVSKFIYKTVTTMTPDIAGFIDLFSDESKKLADTMENFDKRFNELLEALGIERIIVFIDDLDRCSSLKVIETFETIKLFLNTPSCTFVIGADAQKIENAVGEIYSIATGDEQARRDYLEKIIQIPFNIPQQQNADIGAYMALLLLSREVSDEVRTDIASQRGTLVSSSNIVGDCISWLDGNKARISLDSAVVQHDLESTLPFVNIIGGGLKGNPRQIKRFLNILSVRRKLAEANSLEVSAAILIKLAVIEYVWEGFFKQLAETVDPATGISNLLEVMVTEEGREEVAKASPILADSLSTGGLLAFLSAQPALEASLDLRNYLFLAQTSLSRQPLTQQDSASVRIKQLIAKIESDDRIVSTAAVRKTLSEESVVSDAVFEGLLDRFSSVTAENSKVHIVIGLTQISAGNKVRCERVLRFLEGSTIPNAAMLVLPNYLKGFSALGITVPEDVNKKYSVNLKDLLGKKK